MNLFLKRYFVIFHYMFKIWRCGRTDSNLNWPYLIVNTCLVFVHPFRGVKDLKCYVLIFFITFNVFLHQLMDCMYVARGSEIVVTFCSLIHQSYYASRFHNAWFRWRQVWVLRKTLIDQHSRAIPNPLLRERKKVNFCTKLDFHISVNHWYIRNTSHENL